MKTICHYIAIILVWGYSINALAMPGESDSLMSGKISLQKPAGNALQVTVVPGINKKRLALVSGVTGAYLSGVYMAHVGPWWSGQKKGFHVKYDWYKNYWREMDKFGHFYGNIQITRLSAASFRLSGISPRASKWIGFGVSTIFYTALEVTDAGFADWGFSVPDYVANLLGAGYPLLQDYQPLMRHFNFKISYWPSRFYNNFDSRPDPRFYRYEPYTYATGDYDGMTFWLSADVDWLLPEKVRPLWPDWLNIAVGYGAANLPQSNPDPKYREFYLALDYNTDFLPGDNMVMNALRSVLSAIHLPAPSIRWTSQGALSYGFHF